MPDVPLAAAGAGEAGRAGLARLGGVRRGLTLPVVLGSLLALVVLLNVGMGAVPIPPERVLAILAHHAGIDLGIAFTPQQDAVLWNIRLPRVCAALAIGGGLAVSGASLQAIFRNPLADPALVGVSSGAAVGAIGLIVIGFAPVTGTSLPLAAFTGGMAATCLVYSLARFEGRTEVVTLILTGIAVNAIAGGFIGLMSFLATDAELRSIVFWSLGSLGGVTWDTAQPAVALMVAGSIVLLRMRNQLNLMALGEAEARHLGLSPERVRLTTIAASAMVTGAAVSLAGIVGFIGLVVPHLLRLIAGPDHRVLLPASMLLGATLLLGADLAARTVVIPRELPLGVVTALTGGPYFLVLLARTRTRQGGWA